MSDTSGLSKTLSDIQFKHGQAHGSNEERHRWMARIRREKGKHGAITDSCLEILLAYGEDRVENNDKVPGGLGKS